MLGQGRGRCLHPTVLRGCDYSSMPWSSCRFIWSQEVHDVPGINVTIPCYLVTGSWCNCDDAKDTHVNYWRQRGWQPHAIMCFQFCTKDLCALFNSPPTIHFVNVYWLAKWSSYRGHFLQWNSSCKFSLKYVPKYPIDIKDCFTVVIVWTS